ncbi:VWA domain-containing protein [Corynebacterium sp. TAE3-ERU12]|uniref:VWA domain-containing protein n=1 Tax=Corynebacterium sp. TAE3-ERU12 TaxID=2849491 RepID=UPI001C44D167|nr:VWA domain-containing protein [Corynebacterium sp. TAE3-ERU12]MBV7294459.1 VWA domain-containing protein [Corynebacterium sp. TAE3-ERU12]
MASSSKATKHRATKRRLLAVCATVGLLAAGVPAAAADDIDETTTSSASESAAPERTSESTTPEPTRETATPQPPRPSTSAPETSSTQRPAEPAPSDADKQRAEEERQREEEKRKQDEEKKREEEKRKQDEENKKREEEEKRKQDEEDKKREEEERDRAGRSRVARAAGRGPQPAEPPNNTTYGKLEKFVERTSGNPDWLRNSPAANPPVPLKCGRTLNIALVFDMSGSLNEGEREKAAEAGKGVVSKLAGTNSRIGVYNFATDAPSIASAKSAQRHDLTQPSGVSEARQVIDNLKDRPSGYKGTNWQAGLEDVPLKQTDGAGEVTQGYDVVYFITDGVPTTAYKDSANSTSSYVANDVQTFTHISDIDNAIAAANRLKQSGTRVVPIMVDKVPEAQWVLRDEVKYMELDQRFSAKEGDVFFRGDDGLFAKSAQQFRRVTSDTGNVSIFNSSTRADIPWESRGQARVNDLPYYWSARNRNGFPERLTPEVMLAQISDPTSSYFVDSYDNSVQKLKKIIQSPCEGIITIQKNIVNEKGEESPGENWDFAINSYLKDKDINGLVEDDVNAGAPTNRKNEKTNADGIAKVRAVRQLIDEVDNIRIGERQTGGYAIQKNGGNNLVCIGQVGDENGEVSQESIPVTNTSWEENNGKDKYVGVTFPLNLDKYYRGVTCTAVNKQNRATVTKTPVDGDGDGQAAQITPDGRGTLTYQVNVAGGDEADAADVETGVITDQLLLPTGVSLAGGDSKVKVSVKAPNGVTVTEAAGEIPTKNIKNNEFTLAKNVLVEAQKSAVFNITVPIQVQLQGEGAVNWEEVERCEAPEDAEKKMGEAPARGGVGNAALSKKDRFENSYACVGLRRPKNAALGINKVVFDKDAEGNISDPQPIDGASFTLYRTDDNYRFNDGDVADIGNITPGKYALVETEAPEGYDLLAQPVFIDVEGTTDGYVFTLANGTADGGIVELTSGSGADAKYTWTAQVADVRSGGNLPKTGGSGQLPFVLAALAVIAAAIPLMRKQLS